jgi:hypothetical protein
MLDIYFMGYLYYTHKVSDAEYASFVRLKGKKTSYVGRPVRNIYSKSLAIKMLSSLCT